MDELMKEFDMDSVTPVCLVCQQALPKPDKRRGAPRKYCSPLCASRSAQRNRKAIYTHKCVMCDEEFSSYRKDRATCSRACGARAGNWRRYGREPSGSRELVHVPRPSRTHEPVHTVSTWVFTAGDCRVCGSSYVSPWATVTCSAECAHKHEMDRYKQKCHRRRVRMRGGYHERFTSVQIFERDGYRCHICKKRTDPSVHHLSPNYPTLDHLVPVSLGGDHTMVNVATACRICNSRKSDRLAGDQLALL